MSTRKEGYYWVKSNGYWYIDEWSTGRWVDAPKQGYDEIDENQIVRERLTEEQLEQIASNNSWTEDQYKGFITGYKYATNVRV